MNATVDQGFVGVLPPAMLSRPDRELLAEEMLTFERETKRYLPRRCFAAIRVDGKSFSSYTRGLVKPFDEKFADDMDAAAWALAESVGGSVGVFVVSDEISLILTDLMNEDTQPEYGWGEAKLTSITAAISTAAFNADRDFRNPGLFDSRAFTLPDADAVQRYLAYRQGDGMRNAISTMGRLHYGKRGIEGVSANAMMRRLESDGHAIPRRHSLGRFLHKVEETRTVTWTHSRTKVESTIEVTSPLYRLQPAPLFSETFATDWLPPLLSA